MAQPQQIALTDLDLNQLSDVKRQLEEELNHLTESFAQLKQAQAKFSACIDNAKQLSEKPILVPLTNSLYVPGKLSDPDHVIIDVGTGYFVKKTKKQAAKYYSEKVDYIRVNADVLEENVAKKRENMAMVINVIQSKLQAQAANKPDS